MVCRPGCCCSVCGKKLADPNSLCCGCVCDALCVTIIGGGVVECPPSAGTGSGETCGCTEVTAKVDWVDADCAWVGTVVCGTLAIDLKFEVLQLDGDCYFCLTSDCLGLSQFRTGTGTGDECQVITPGCGQDKFCGEFTRDGDQRQGSDPDAPLGEWRFDASDCGDLMCTSVIIEAICAERINPAGRGTDRICTNCDCVCNCVCLTYEEDACLSQTERVCYVYEGTGTDSDSWTHTFTCPDGDQTVTITLERGSDGCCEWHLETSRGTVEDASTGTGADASNKKSNCPTTAHTWTLTDTTGTGGSGSVTISCAECIECLIDTCCCADPLPQTLTATVYNVNECPCVDGTQISLSLVEITEGVGGTGAAWQGDGAFCDLCSFRIIVRCSPDATCVWTLEWCDGGGICGDFETRCLSMNSETSGVACAGFTEDICCDPLVVPFTGGSNDCCCEPDTPATEFCFVVTE